MPELKYRYNLALWHIGIPQKRREKIWQAAGQLLLLSAILAILFWGVFRGGYSLWSNDGPFGLIAGHPNGLDRLTGDWNDRNGIGDGGPGTVSLTNILFWVLGPVGFAKFYAPLSLLFLGMAGWFFFVELGLRPLACRLGSIAFALNSLYFSTACWGVAAHPIATGTTLMALGLLVDKRNSRLAWIRVAVAGWFVGFGVADASDVGVLCAMFVALGIVVQGLFIIDGKIWKRLVMTTGRLALVTFMALFLAASALQVLFPLLNQTPK